ncbi:hypothetical protein [Streptomyces sp. NPDC087538]|uniref:hypothetical protein n=1 Tax=Streptomyces sp. NPDC087538 TaxID=3365797 RepID=UPI0037F6763F
MSAPTELPRMDRAEKHAETVHRIYRDRRAAPPARELLLAVAYAVAIAPGDPGRVLTTAARALGRKGSRPRFDALVAADAPRYRPPREADDWGPGEAPHVWDITVRYDRDGRVTTHCCGWDARRDTVVGQPPAAGEDSC